jgi:hypothetical protein
MKKKTKTELGPDFDQYSIKWDERRVTFILMAEEIKFYGSWRKTRFGEKEEELGGIAYSIDIWAQSDTGTCSVDSIHYIDQDPRKTPKSLNADICACINKWLYLSHQGKTPNLSELQKKSEKPIMTIKKSATLDGILFKLREFRDTCLSCGGFRAIILESDIPGNPRLTVQANFTEEAHALNGKVPKLFEAEAIVSHAKDKKAGKTARSTPEDGGGIQNLLDSLKKSKDKAQQRKIRGMLRKLGYHGGLRNANQETETETEKET